MLSLTFARATLLAWAFLLTRVDSLILYCARFCAGPAVCWASQGTMMANDLEKETSSLFFAVILARALHCCCFSHSPANSRTMGQKLLKPHNSCPREMSQEPQLQTDAEWYIVGFFICLFVCFLLKILFQTLCYVISLRKTFFLFFRTSMY